MPDTLTLSIEKIESLTQASYAAFCEDMAGMFDVQAVCTQGQTIKGDLNKLKNEFKKITAVNTVSARGTLDGQFWLLLDQAAIFTLSGIVVMLPEKRIKDQVKNGTLNDAQGLNDAIKEVGNLLVGSWDRVFRENLAGHIHFKQDKTFIGQPWSKPAEVFGRELTEEISIVTVKLEIADYGQIVCAGVFPSDIFEPKQNSAAPDTGNPAATVQTPGETPVEPTPASVSQPQPTEPAVPAGDPKPPLTSQPAHHTTLPSYPGFDINRPVMDVLGPQFTWIGAEDSIESAMQLMQRDHTGYLLVGKQGNLEGILSRTDAASAVSPYLKPAFANWRRPQDDASLQIRVKWFMTRIVRTITPQTPIGAAIDMMCRFSIRTLVVVDQQQVRGIITDWDILRNLIAGGSSELAGHSQPTIPAVPISL